MAKFATMVIMATIEEKIVAMLATIKEMRKIVKKPDPVFDLIVAKGDISQKDMISLLPDMSSRSVRRHLEYLLQGGMVLRRKEGKEVFYSRNTDYPQ